MFRQLVTAEYVLRRVVVHLNLTGTLQSRPSTMWTPRMRRQPPIAGPARLQGHVALVSVSSAFQLT